MGRPTSCWDYSRESQLRSMTIGVCSRVAAPRSSTLRIWTRNVVPQHGAADDYDFCFALYAVSCAKSVHSFRLITSHWNNVQLQKVMSAGRPAPVCAKSPAMTASGDINHILDYPLKGTSPTLYASSCDTATDQRAR